jgi:hypothetical protein
MADYITAALIALSVRRGHAVDPALQQLEAMRERLQQLERLHQLVQASGPLTCEQVLRIWRKDL